MELVGWLVGWLVGRSVVRLEDLGVDGKIILKLVLEK
jgi:hypothetical protein